MGEEPIKEKQTAGLPVRLIAVPTSPGFDIFYELWTARDKPNLWRQIMISEDGQVRAAIAVHLMAAHIVRGQQSDAAVRVQQSLSEADALLAVIESEEKDTVFVAAVLDEPVLKTGGSGKGGGAATGAQPDPTKV